MWITQTSWVLLYNTFYLIQLLRSTSGFAPDYFCSLVEVEFVTRAACESHPTLPAASRTIFLWNPFSVRLAHVPVGLHDGLSASPHLPVCERDWYLGCAELSSPFLLPLWRLGEGEQMCQEPLQFYIHFLCPRLGRCLSSWQTLHLWVGA